MIRNLIFDFDGTLADSRGLALKLYNELCGKYGYPPVTEQQMIALSGLSIADRLRAVHIPAYRLPGLVMQLLRSFTRSVDQLHPFAELPELVRQLKQAGYRLSIISSNSPTNIKHFLHRFEMECFDDIEGSRNLFGKSRKINRYLNQNGLSSAETLYIGDELRDIEACRQSGIPVIAVAWGYDAKELLVQGDPDRVIDHPSELRDLLLHNRPVVLDDIRS